jgi:ABC-2 type transport system ATP-binding protein
MDEADQLSDTIYIMDRGKIIANGTSESLKNSLGMDLIYFKTDSDEKSFNIIRAMDGITDVRSFPEGLVISLKDGSRFMPKLVEKIRNEKIEIKNINLKKPTLDDVFIHFTGRGLREENQEKEKTTLQHE